MNADNLLFRCSSLGSIMTEARSKSEPISETAKAHLLEVYIDHKYGRRKVVTTKYMEKGLQVEEDAITLYSRFTKLYHAKNEDRISNEFIAGTPDLFNGTSIHDADTIIDIKSSWDIFTFHAVIGKGIKKLYYWQLMGYMALTGAKNAKLAYCLVDTPDTILNDEKRKLHWKMGLIDDQNADFEQACNEIDKLGKYDDIPVNERVHIIEIERDEQAINAIYQRVAECRKWMNENLYNTITNN